MDTLLDALQEGRLFELPENDKTHALQFLSHIIEAFPEVPAGTDIVGQILAREQNANTGLGKGWACPHARVAFDEDLKGVIGWSPGGIDYGAPDGKPVRLVVMYLVPANQRNHYLREISILAKALETYPGVEQLPTLTDLNGIRNYLLDLIDASKETVGPDARARMIRLQTRPIAEIFPTADLSRLIIEPVTVITSPGMQPLTLTQNDELRQALDRAEGIIERLETDGVFQNGGWRVLKRSATDYQGRRRVYDCLALRLNHGNPFPAK